MLGKKRANRETTRLKREYDNSKTHIPACHLTSHACFSICCSSRAHVWDAFQLAHASTSFYCLQKRSVSFDDKTIANSDLGLDLLGIPPKIDVSYPVEDIAEEKDDVSSLPAVKIHDEDVSLRFLICGVRSSMVSWKWILAYASMNVSLCDKPDLQHLALLFCSS